MQAALTLTTSFFGCCVLLKQQRSIVPLAYSRYDLSVIGLLVVVR